MATVVINTIDGTRYKYYVRYLGGEHKWKYLGKASEVGVDAGVQDLSDEEIEEIRDGVNAHAPSGVTIGSVEGDALREFTRSLDEDDIESLLDTALFDSEHNYEPPNDILRAVRDVTDDSELDDAFETLFQRRIEDPDDIWEAADKVEEELGCRPFEISIDEPYSDFMDPKVSLSVDDSRMVENPDINAALINESEANNDSTGRTYQQDRLEMWNEALGDGRVSEFKRSVDDIDALGFALPETIPATAGEDGKTSVTEIPYIGDATAAEMHPEGGDLSIEDLDGLTEKQRAWIEQPHDRENGYDSPLALGIAGTVPASTKKNTTDVLGSMLDMANKRSLDSAALWDSGGMHGGSVGIFNDASELDGEFTLDAVTNTEKKERPSRDGEYYNVENQSGESEQFAAKYWELIQEVSDAAGSEVRIGEKAPASVTLPDGNDMVVTPAVIDED